MKTGVWIAGIGIALGISAPASAQLITSTGYVERVPAEGDAIVVRMGGREQRVAVSPEATITINGRQADLINIPYNARIRMMSWKDRNGNLHASVVRVDQPFTATRSAASQPGTVITGHVAGLYPAESVVLLRTNNGFRQVNLGTAPVMLDGREVSVRDLALGDQIQVQSAYPPGGLLPLPSLAVVLTPQSVAGSRQTFRSSGAAVRPPTPSQPASGSSQVTPQPVVPRY